MNEMSEKAIREFWDAHPCGESQVEKLGSDYEIFFAATMHLDTSGKLTFCAAWMPLISKVSRYLRLGWDRVLTRSRSSGEGPYGLASIYPLNP